MSKTKLTLRTVRALEPRAERYEVFDSELKRFGVRVSPNGSKSWIVLYRPGDGGRRVAVRRYTIGKLGELTPEEARDAATNLLAAITLGSDPATARKARRSVVSIRELAVAFLRDHVTAKRRESTAALYTDILNRLVIPEFGAEKADLIKRADLARLHGALSKTPFQANRMLAVCGSMFTFGGKAGFVPEGFNPARGIEKYPEDSRERYLTTDELERLGESIREAETVGIPWVTDPEKAVKRRPKDPEKLRTTISVEAAAALRLLILTGARLREVLHLRWEDVDVQRGLLFLPISKTRKKTIVLNAPALAVLASLERRSTYVIPGEPATLPDGSLQDRPRSDLKRPWAVVSRRAGLAARLHDLRHTFASYAASGGLGLPVIGKLLGHTNASTTQRYAHVASDPLRKASDATATTIAAHMGEPQGSDGAPVSP
jgi:integrase